MVLLLFVCICLSMLPLGCHSLSIGSCLSLSKFWWKMILARSKFLDDCYCSVSVSFVVKNYFHCYARYFWKFHTSQTPSLCVIYTRYFHSIFLICHSVDIFIQSFGEVSPPPFWNPVITTSDPNTAGVALGDKTETMHFAVLNASCTILSPVYAFSSSFWRPHLKIAAQMHSRIVTKAARSLAHSKRHWHRDFTIGRLSSNVTHGANFDVISCLSDNGTRLFVASWTSAVSH